MRPVLERISLLFPFIQPQARRIHFRATIRNELRRGCDSVLGAKPKRKWKEKRGRSIRSRTIMPWIIINTKCQLAPLHSTLHTLSIWGGGIALHMTLLTIGILDYVLSVCDWVCVHNFRPELFLFESVSAFNLSCPKISKRYLSGSPMCQSSHGMIDVMLMRTLTKNLAWKQNIPGLKLRGSRKFHILKFKAIPICVYWSLKFG